MHASIPPPTRPPPRRIMRKPCNLWIIPAGRGTLRQFKPDGGMMPPKTPTDLTQARPPPMFSKDHATFLGFQVLVVSFHGNISCPLGCRCRTAILSASMPALIAMRFDPDLKGKYNALRKAGRRAIGVVVRKLLETANALVRADRIWVERCS